MKIIEIATAEIGTKEDPPDSNKTKYGKWFGYDGVRWCATFVSWVYFHAGFPLGKIGYSKGFAGCQTAIEHFRKTGEITTTPQPGDIVLFDWQGDKRFDHTGIFVNQINSKYFESIEGNTSFSNQSNGGEVMKRQRAYHNCIFVHPKVLG